MVIFTSPLRRGLKIFPQETGDFFIIKKNTLNDQICNNLLILEQNLPNLFERRNITTKSRPQTTTAVVAFSEQAL